MAFLEGRHSALCPSSIVLADGCDTGFGSVLWRLWSPHCKTAICVLPRGRLQSFAYRIRLNAQYAQYAQ